ncbi:PREDICTED: zinc finger CCCH domain-containing protein 55-like isoform X2 [Camelina sativa]|uniref:Zinc finger CCCH domain-containing protein 55-like isoform X2 n=1 Tax=Camelina sativa TaxID=90675 RepID=A0ABM0X2I1_CAMSA|nr:PREDICTED: zinc finger CCCH domain-containing protein 55-like isoform X2 [Camelina sativa]
MDPGDPTSIIFTKIRTLEPENASKIIGYFLLQDMEQRDLIRIAFGPDTLIQALCRKAKSDLGLSSNGFSLNPMSRPINIHGHHHSLSQSSPRNGFLDFSRNPSNPLPFSLTSTTLRDSPSNFNSRPFRDGSSFFASSSGDEQQQLSNQFPFVEDPFANFHKRSFSANDASFESEELGFGGGPGYHRFPQGGLVDDFGSSGGFGSPSEMDYVLEKMMRIKLAQQKRMVAAQLMAAACGSPLSHRQGSEQFGEEGGYSYSPSRYEREDAVSKQIYLTFPSESSFTDEDVSAYFSDFGPVEDVRIPYQQQRMYGFVTFAKAETVRTILARGNPHFICDSRVLVKPYKEKGKILQKRQQQQLHQLLERGNYSPSSSPSGMDSRDLYECRLGPRMFSNKTQEMLRRKSEEADLQQAIEVELQRRRFLNLQLPDMEHESIQHHQRSPSFSRAHIPPRFNHSLLFHSENNNEEMMEGNSDRSEQHLQQVADSNEERGYSNDFYKGQETSLENTLPDSLFGSPKKSGETCKTEYDTEQKASSDQSA